MSETILTISHLRKDFGSNQVLKDVDFQVEKGDVTCIIGASGSGKSTLLRCINLLETPTSGEILFHGQGKGRHGVPVLQPLQQYDSAGKLYGRPDDGVEEGQGRGASGGNAVP